MMLSLMLIILLTLLFVTHVGPSAGPPQDEDFEGLDSDVLWTPERSDQGEFQEFEFSHDPEEDHDLSKSEDYYNFEDSQVEPKMSSGQKFKNTYKNMPSEDLLNALDYLAITQNANGNPALEPDNKRMIQFPWSKGRKGKPHGASKIKNQYCRISSPTGRPGCHASTTDRRCSTFSVPPSSPTCPSYTPKPTTVPTPPPPPPPPPPTPKPPPPPSCKDQSNKCRQKPKIPQLKPKTAKMLLKIIMDTKQHVLFALDIINHMENEVLFRSPDSCRQAYNMKADKGGKCPPSMPIPKAKKPRKKEHIASIDPQANWCPAISNQAQRPKNLLENALQPMVANRPSHKKYRNNGQKQQAKMKNIPPGMVPILT